MIDHDEDGPGYRCERFGGKAEKPKLGPYPIHVSGMGSTRPSKERYADCPRFDAPLPSSTPRIVAVALIVLFGLVLFFTGPCSPSTAGAATWARIRWTNPPQVSDSVRCRRVLGVGDTSAVSLYGNTATLALKGPGTPDAVDSGYISISTANVVGPAAIRIVLQMHNGAGWSEPSNAVSIFYAARDTFYLGPPLEAPAWSRGPGIFGFTQEVGDDRFVNWRHAEVVQAAARARLCLIYGYACRRGARDSSWCAQ